MNTNELSEEKLASISGGFFMSTGLVLLHAYYNAHPITSEISDVTLTPITK